MILGVIQERKVPQDRRVVLTPFFAQQALEQYPDLYIKIEPSAIRCYKDQEYFSHPRLEITTNMSSCDVLVGVKEVPVEALIANKTYVFFSHTIKKQEFNRKLLQACLKKNITLMDHETFVDQEQKRIIGFGRYAGIVGAYNTLRAFGLKYELFDLAKAQTLKTKEDLIKRLKWQVFPPIKIVITGNSRVAHGIMEILDGMKAKKVTPENFLKANYNRVVYTQLDAGQYYRRKDGQQGSKQEFYVHPELYESDFEKYSKVADILITGHFHQKGAPEILTQQMLKSAKNMIKVVGDVSCDVDHGPIASTLRVSTIEDPFYGYHPRTNSEVEFDNPSAITVVAIDNLPTELPYEASEGFAKDFVERILPSFFNDDKENILNRSIIATQGELTPKYAYLQDFVDEKQ